MNWKNLIKLLALLGLIYFAFVLLNIEFDPTSWSKKDMRLFIIIIFSFIFGWNTK